MGDITNRKNILDNNVETLLREIAVAEGFQDYTIENTNGSVKGDGYMGIINTVKISDKNNSRVLNLIVKTASKSDALRSQATIEELFDRESYMYDTIFTTFKDFEDKKKLSPCNFIPKFYNSLLENKCETIVLENLKESGYTLYERRIPMNEDHVRLVLTEFGRLHALSFALRDQDPEKFEKVVGCMDDRFIRYVVHRGFINNFIHQCKKAEESVNEDKEVLEVYKAFIDSIPKFFEDLLTKSVDEYSVALHGDCWTNNMMFKYEDKVNPTKPSQVCFLDFQISRLGSPVLDLLYFFYACSSKEIINDLDNYLQVYYNSFSDYLRKLGSNPDKMFPYLVLQEHWKKFSRYGLVLSLFLIHIMLSEQEEVIDFIDECEAGRSMSAAFDYKLKKADEYRERIKPIILHFVQRKFI